MRLNISISAAGKLSKKGITGFTQGPADLVLPSSEPERRDLIYGLVFPFQIAPRECALLCNLRLTGMGTYDFEYGNDLLLFDNPSNLGAGKAVPVNRNNKLIDPVTGEPKLVLKFPVISGFVPLGAKRADGSPHPQAGTGFGISQALAFPMTEAGHFDWKDKFQRMLETHQFSYDGIGFQITDSKMYAEDSPLRPSGSHFSIFAAGLTQAIPDGDDLLLAVWAVQDGVPASGISRWVRLNGHWQPVSFVPVTGPSFTEPSLIRDLDNALLFSAREDLERRIRIWRSWDNGIQWQTIVDIPAIRKGSPVSLNRAADGTPYIAANKPDDFPNYIREVLCLWSVNSGRTGLEEPIPIRDARAEFGAPTAGGGWMVDHPNGVTLQLADGQWHHLLAYRMLDNAEFAMTNPPVKQTGAYLEEIFSKGPALPAWKFA